MTTFTLDTNCIIALENGEPEAVPLRALADAHDGGRFDVAIVNVSASERQLGDRYISNYGEFIERVDRLKLSHLPTLGTITYWNFGFYGLGTWGASPEMLDRERQIHDALFPTIPFYWQEFAASAGIGVNDTTAPEAKTWRNAFCDRQMFWAHDNHGRDVFVTSDANFRRKLIGNRAFPGAQVATPFEAVKLLE